MSSGGPRRGGGGKGRRNKRHQTGGGNGGNDTSGRDVDPQDGGDNIVPLKNSDGVSLPDYVVDGLEARYEKNYKEGLPDRLAELDLVEDFPWRPGYGTDGRGVILRANYCRLKRPSNSPRLSLCRYELTVKPDASGGKLMQIIRLFLQSPEHNEYRDRMVTDFSAIVLTLGQVTDKVITVSYRTEYENEPCQNAPKYTVTLKFQCVLNVGDLMKYLTLADYPKFTEQTSVIQALNILINYYAKSSSNIKTLGSSKNFHLVNPEWKEIKTGLRVVRGFFTSVRPAAGRLLLNVNVCHTVFYEPIRLDKLMREYFLANQNNVHKVAQFVKKLRVETTHLRNKRGERIRRIKTIYNLARKDDGTKDNGECIPHPPKVAYDGAGPTQVLFWLEDRGGTASTASKKKGQESSSAAGGRYISVYDYFRSTYNLEIEHRNVSVVNVGTRENPSYLPGQCCIVMPGQVPKVHLTPSQQTGIIDFAVRRPEANIHSIKSKGLDNLGLNTDAFIQLKQGEVEVEDDFKLITVHGRVLAGPIVLYRNNKSAQVADGNWNMVPRGAQKLQFIDGMNLQKWMCLNIEMPDVYRDAHSFTKEGRLPEIMRSFCEVMDSAGIRVTVPQKPQPLPLQTIKLNSTEDPELDRVLHDIKIRKKPQLVFVILPKNQIPLYSRLKQLADVKYGIHTVCAVASKLAKERNDQYFRNVALKVNLKLGGNNQLVSRQHLGILAQDDTMIVGIDVTHPSPGSATNARSRSAMVASIDAKLSQWPGILGAQKGGKEMVDELKTMLISRLELRRQHCKSFPKNIVVYRDGVSEGQFLTVLQEELPQLRAACREKYPAPDTKKGFPRMSIIICGKRHHTRFYVTKRADADNSGNPQAGTVCDSGVTELRVWDFYLQAHAAIKGTARPCHYTVLLDEIFRSTFPAPEKNAANELQKLTLSLSYVFGRATKAVSYCTPAYYADILCERARHHNYKEYDTPTNSDNASSVKGGASGNGQAKAEDEKTKVHDDLKNTMFYI